MPDFIVSWRQNGGFIYHRVRGAASPEEAAQLAVDRHDHHEDVFGVEVAVWEKKLARHDVIVVEDEEAYFERMDS
jgi:hypothetical protein